MTALWLKLVDLDPVHDAGIPRHGDVGEATQYAHVNTETGLIVARVATAAPARGGRYELWCIPPGGRAVLVATDEFGPGDASGDAPHCDRTEKLMNVRAPF